MLAFANRASVAILRGGGDLMASYCRHCGTRLTDNSKFCPECGAPLTEQAQARTKSYWGESILTLIVLLVFFPAGLVIGFLFYRQAKKLERAAGTRLPGVRLLTAIFWTSLSLVGAVLYILIAILII